ncbi:MAG: thiamine ABC transporter substrate-binding protein [Bdellovibrionales bacterium]|nr:thiamine ABC transporter substrate-binding protein [Bdellovibrionales bacterium]
MSLSFITVLVFGAGFFRWVYLGKSIPRVQILLPTLRVLSYESFAGVTGVGPELIKNFEKVCQCQVDLSSVSDSGMMMEKLRQKNFRVDIVVGLDQMLLPQAQSILGWKKLNFKKGFWDSQIQGFVKEFFVPYDWAPLALIYRKDEVEPPQDIKSLLHPRFLNSISLQDPRSSSPGLQFLFALYSWVGEKKIADFLAQIKQNVHSISPSWSMAYGLFQRGQAKMTFSYVTSLVYHWTVEKNMSYDAVVFKQGHPVQMEYVGIPKNCDQCDLAERFLKFLLSIESQKLVMNKNFMFPVRPELIQTDKAFSQLPKMPLLMGAKEDDFNQKKSVLEEMWLKAMQ